MLNLLLISGFTAFIFAVANQLISILESFIDMRLIRAFITLCVSACGTGLIGADNTKMFIVYTVSSAFFGSSLVVAVERINSYQPATVHAIGRER
jgi:hypothetical protein